MQQEIFSGADQSLLLAPRDAGRCTPLPVMGALARAGITTVFVEHDMEMVRRYAHRVAVWENGRVVAQGQPHGILHDSQIRESIAGMA